VNKSTENGTIQSMWLFLGLSAPFQLKNQVPGNDLTKEDSLQLDSKN